MLLFVASVLFSGMMFAQDYHWADFDYHDYTRPMIVFSRVQFNGEFQNRADIEVAAFVGDELRGRSFLFEPYPNSPIAGQYFAFAPCYYDAPGETFTFKAYDHLAELEYDICATELVGQDDGHGSIENPIILNFSRTEEPTYGPEYPWVPSTAYSGEGMVVTAQIKINGVLVDRGSYEVGAFCGEECRATSGTQGLDDWTEDDLGYFAFMNVMGNNGDSISFYLHDLENNCNFAGICFTTIELENGGELGIDILGGDIFVLNFVTEQIFTKEIEGYAEDSIGHYYLIASPIGEVDPENVTNMLENSFDLYYFNQSSDLEWINYKGADGNYDLLPGIGYLYANSDSVTLTFTGFPYGGDGEVTLTYDASANFPGWNLVGNPFTDTAYIDREFYVMNSIGTEIIAGEGNSVAAMEGIFVVAETDGETMTFSTEEPSRGASLTMNITQNRGAAIDRAIVRFGEESTLPKFMLNENNTKVYIPQDNKDYAVVSVNSDMGEMPVNFKAAKNGTYTLSFSNEEVSFSYLHLIDNLTGVDVDLLETASYSFDAKTTDYATRFKLVFATGNATDDSFVFFSNGNWVINNDGKAIAQVVDVTGRILKSEKIEGCHSMSINAAPGVYMIRLISGNDVKVQKVVVK